jgi:hypothetical protein
LSVDFNTEHKYGHFTIFAGNPTLQSAPVKVGRTAAAMVSAQIQMADA